MNFVTEHTIYIYTILNDVIETSDVIYMTRVQRERYISNELMMGWETEYDSNYAITPEHMNKAKYDMVLMHPLPRVNEIPTSLDNDPRSAYFRQIKYGLSMRMSVLRMILTN